MPKPATRKGVEVPVADPSEVTIGTHNPRNDFIDQISRQSEQDREHGEDTDDASVTALPDTEPPAPPVDEPEDVPAEVAPPGDKPESAPQVEPPAEDDFLSLDAIGKKRVKLKIDGEERVLTLEEVMRDVQKKGAADRRLEESTRLVNEAKALFEQAKLVPQAQPSQDAVPMQPPLDEDVAAVVRAIRTGTDEEANFAAHQWDQALRKKAILPAADIRNIVNDAVDFRNSAEWVKNEYSDLFGDTRLAEMFADLDERQVRAQDKRPYRERYKDIGDGLRAWRDSLVKPALAAQAAQTLEAKREKKAAVVTPTAASVKDVPPPAEDDNAEPNAQDVIAQIAKARGQNLRG